MNTVEPRSRLTGLFDYPFFFPDPVIVLRIHNNIIVNIVGTPSIVIPSLISSVLRYLTPMRLGL